MKKFIDQTGLPGPDLWEDGRHPEGKGDHPVRGVSWYEAAAYAKFVKKQLPTHIHWWRASAGRDEHLRPLSNLNGAGPHPIGQDEGIGVFGVYDMGGNVKEWCRTKYGENDRSICGGHWRGPSYLAREISHAPPMSREDSYGFRCARYFVKGNEWAVEPRIVKPVVFDPPATAEEVAHMLSHSGW